MAEVIKRLKKDKLAPREFKFLSDLYQYENMVVVRDQIIDEKDQIIDEKNQIIDEMQANRVKSINNFWKLGIPISAIAQALEISVEEVKALIKTT
jgi:DNA-binding response OmpR family regulator